MPIRYHYLNPVWQHTFVSPSAFSRRAVVSYWRKYVHEVLVNRLGGLSLPRLTDRPDMTLDVYRGRKTTIQQQPLSKLIGRPGTERYLSPDTTSKKRESHKMLKEKKYNYNNNK